MLFKRPRILFFFGVLKLSVQIERELGLWSNKLHTQQMAAPKQHTKKKKYTLLMYCKLNTKTPRDMIEIQSTGIMYSTVTQNTKIIKKNLLPNGSRKRRLILFGRQQNKEKTRDTNVWHKLSLHLSFKL